VMMNMNVSVSQACMVGGYSLRYSGESYCVGNGFAVLVPLVLVLKQLGHQWWCVILVLPGTFSIFT